MTCMLVRTFHRMHPQAQYGEVVKRPGYSNTLPTLNAKDPIPGHTHHLVCSEVDVPGENEKVTTGEGSELKGRLRLSATRNSIPMDHLIGT